LNNGLTIKNCHTFGFGECQNEPKNIGWTHCQANTSKEYLSSVHNLAEKRSIGFINYELKVADAKHLQVSSTLVKNKHSNLAGGCQAGAFKDHMTAAQHLKEMHLIWNEKASELACISQLSLSMYYNTFVKSFSF